MKNVPHSRFQPHIDELELDAGFAVPDVFFELEDGIEFLTGFEVREFRAETETDAIEDSLLGIIGTQSELEMLAAVADHAHRLHDHIFQHENWFSVPFSERRHLLDFTHKLRGDMER